MIDLKDISVVTCNYNTPEFTRRMAESLFYHLNQRITMIIMDNGKDHPLNFSDYHTYNVYNNTCHSITPDHRQGSHDHCHAVDYAIKNLVSTKWVVISDNDVVYKPTVKGFLENLDESVDCYGEIGWDHTPPDRIFPYFCVINRDKFIADNMDYYDPDRLLKYHMDGMYIQQEYNFMDTGYSFYEDAKAKNWLIREIKMDDYIMHLGQASLYRKQFRDWVEATRHLYDEET